MIPTYPCRDDVGDLIVLHLTGSYREMGRQQVDLLGETAFAVAALNREAWGRLIKSYGPLAKAADLLLPAFWMGPYRRFEGSALYEEIAGIADGLGVSGTAGWRSAFGFLGSGSTMFFARGKATADGQPIVGKNSDWADADGVRRPVVTVYHPAGGGLEYITAGWPLLPATAITLNAAGVSICMNFFNADSVLGLGLVQWPWRRAVQTARSTADVIALFKAARHGGMSGFFGISDAAGDIALIETTPKRMAVYRPDGDWFGQANHARTAEMIPHDRGRSLDSSMRGAAIDHAVAERVGRISPTTASEIMRDRSNTAYAADSSVGNPAVLNSAVIQPASRILWHSTSKQPLAPFGEMVGFSLAGDQPSPLPADPGFLNGGFEVERSVLEEARGASRLFTAGQYDGALAAFDRLRETGMVLDPRRLQWSRARCLWAVGRLHEALELLEALGGEGSPFDVRANATVASAVVCDRLGLRAEALARYEKGQQVLAEHTEFNDGLIAPLGRRISSGLQAPHNADAWEFPGLQRIAV
ncbi:MAG: C45 family peptidase [Dehalococcoidia bacterium]